MKPARIVVLAVAVSAGGVAAYLASGSDTKTVATELITPRDLLTHRSGLPRHDFIRFSTPLTRAELVRRIRYLEPNRTFRDVYQYNNLMYVTAGFLAGEIAGGADWQDGIIQLRFWWLLFPGARAQSPVADRLVFQIGDDTGPQQ